MKEIILNEYGISVDVKEYKNSIGIFYIDYQKYIFLKVDRPLKDLEYIFNVTQNTKYHSIIKNKKESIGTKYKGQNYVLLKINHPENDEILLKDIISNQIIVKENIKELDRTSWSSLWAVKNDYLEYQISELGKDHPSAIKSFSYYIGLSENAISYFNMIPKDGLIAFSQKRVFYPNTALNFYNPINLVIDYRIRDIAEYIKNAFWKGENAIILLKNLINLNTLFENEYRLLFVRLLYPSNFFDTLGEVLEKKKEDDSLLIFIDNAEKYRLFLKECYYIISTKVNLLGISWIIEEH